MTTSRSITSEQRTQYKRFVDDGGRKALRELGLDREGLQRLFKRGGEFQAHVIEGIRRFSAKQPDYSLAQSILGVDFITPEEVAKARGIVYGAEQLELLAGNIPPAETLHWLKGNDFALMPCPPDAKSILDVRALNPDYFYSKGPDKDDSGWYDEANEKFARNDKVEALCWIALRKEPVENSLNKTWTYQQALVAEPMMVPNAAEATWALTTYKAVRDIYLLEDLYVRTSSCDSDGRRVVLGDFDAGGLRVSYGWGGNRYSDLGVASARKF